MKSKSHVTPLKVNIWMADLQAGSKLETGWGGQQQPNEDVNLVPNAEQVNEYFQ